MKLAQINKFLEKVSSVYEIHSTVKERGNLHVQKISELKEIDWSGEIPKNSWKQVFLSPKEVLSKTVSDRMENTVNKVGNFTRMAAVGMNVLDLKALVLYDQAFEKDAHYQKRRRNTLVIGYHQGSPADYGKYKLFSYKFEENILEHLIFDIFLVYSRTGNFKVFSGSEDGQEILEKYGIKNYEHIQFAGNVPESGPSPLLLKTQKAVAESVDDKIWQELGEKCLACGKCTIACPTCFCFDVLDRMDQEGSHKERRWGSCFFENFSRIASNRPEGHQFLDKIKQRIYFWYEHKFVRIPHEWQIPGCVNCGRCTKVCPVGIDIEKNIKRILKTLITPE